MKCIRYRVYDFKKQVRQSVSWWLVNFSHLRQIHTGAPLLKILKKCESVQKFVHKKNLFLLLNTKSNGGIIKAFLFCNNCSCMSNTQLKILM